MELKQAILNTFSNPSGKSVLAYILHQCTFFETNPNNIDVSRLSFANKLLAEGGMNLQGDMGKYTDLLLLSADDEIKDKEN